MTKIREGNDFKLKWIIMQDAATPLETAGIYDEHLYLIDFRGRVELRDFQRTANSISLEVTPTMAPVLGIYELQWFFKIPDDRLYRGYRNRAFAANVFSIVDSSAEDDNKREIEVITILNT